MHATVAARPAMAVLSSGALRGKDPLQKGCWAPRCAKFGKGITAAG